MAVRQALYGHCKEVYNAMLKDAQVRDLEGHKVNCYEGFTTKLVKDLGLNTPQYTYVFQALEAMDCVRRVRRGGGGAPSLVALLQEPTPELFKRTGANAEKKSAPALEAHDQQLRDLHRRVSLVERTLGIVSSQ